MKELQTIQREHKLNDVFRLSDKPGPDGTYHNYFVTKRGMWEEKRGGVGTTEKNDGNSIVLSVWFHYTPEKDTHSNPGVTDADLLEIVRDRLTDFQNGPFACQSNADALNHVTAALMALNARTQNLAARGVLGVDAL